MRAFPPNSTAAKGRSRAPLDRTAEEAWDLLLAPAAPALGGYHHSLVTAPPPSCPTSSLASSIIEVPPAAAVHCSVVSAFVYLRLVVLMYMEPAQEPEPARLPVAILTALTLAALVTLLGGIAPGSLMQWAVAP